MLGVIAAIIGVYCASAAAGQAPSGPAGSGIATPSGRALILAELAWAHPDADKIRLLTKRPGECLREAADEEAAYLVETGRAAFGSPLLFGGQAARGGISCGSCHIDGRDNPDFFLAGLSGDAGTADVTSSIFSATREDGVFNPAPIPSLVGVAGKERFGSRKPAASLHAFIESAVTDEFQGAPPPQAVTDGLAAYVAHLDPDFCPAAAEARTPFGDVADIRRTLEAAASSLRRDDAATADFLLASARYALREINGRYAAPSLGAQREALRDVSRALAGVRTAAVNDVSLAQALLADIVARLPALAGNLECHRRGSLYDVSTLRDALDSAAQ